MFLYSDANVDARAVLVLSECIYGVVSEAIPQAVSYLEGQDLPENPAKKDIQNPFRPID